MNYIQDTFFIFFKSPLITQKKQFNINQVITKIQRYLFDLITDQRIFMNEYKEHEITRSKNNDIMDILKNKMCILLDTMSHLRDFLNTILISHNMTFIVSDLRKNGGDLLTSIDQTKALKKINQRVEQGDAENIYLKGIHLLNIQSSEQTAMGLKLIQISANKNNANAQIYQAVDASIEQNGDALNYFISTMEEELNGSDDFIAFVEDSFDQKTTVVPTVQEPQISPEEKVVLHAIELMTKEKPSEAIRYLNNHNINNNPNGLFLFATHLLKLTQSNNDKNIFFNGLFFMFLADKKGIPLAKNYMQNILQNNKTIVWLQRLEKKNITNAKLILEYYHHTIR